MSLADEVLAEHTKASLGDYCSVCHDAWPCEPLRLARSLKAAEDACQEMTWAEFIGKKWPALVRAVKGEQP